ncbi:hypothetical protein FACS189499_04540 [Clostridia bacterium]|nr:hypothetical protein FACS189499_04540 [Clostridia bacterium]
MLSFRPPKISDAHPAGEILFASGLRGSEYTFANNYLWRNYYDVTTAFGGDYLIVRTKFGYFPPVCKNNTVMREVLAEIEAYEKKTGSDKLTFCRVNAESKIILTEMFPGAAVTEDRDSYDYVYNISDLAELRGKKLHQKRNHLNRFLENQWSFEPLSAENVNECIKMNKRWAEINCDENESDENTDSKAAEIAVTSEALENFEALRLFGGVLRVDGTVAGFTFGERISAEMFVTHSEKAFADIQGAYTAVNYLFANLIAETFPEVTLINREDDAGKENLRKAKMSYRPVYLLEKYSYEIPIRR